MTTTRGSRLLKTSQHAMQIAIGMRLAAYDDDDDDGGDGGDSRDDGDDEDDDDF